MEQMQYNLLFRWFVGLGIDDPVWVPTVFTKNRDRLLTTEMSRKVMAAILAHREVAPLLSIARQGIAQQCPERGMSISRSTAHLSTRLIHRNRVWAVACA